MRGRLLLLIGVCALVTTACTETSVTTPPTDTPSDTPVATLPRITEPATGEGPACLVGDSPFADRGLVATLGGPAGDATELSSVRWAGHDGCERVVLDFATSDAAPASALGPTTVRHASEIGVVTVRLPPELTTTTVMDSLVEGDIAERLFVYRDLEGLLNLDLHLAAAAEVRAFVVAGPARAVVDLRPAPAGLPQIGAPSVSDDLVVLAPLAGPTEYPLRVRGYARNQTAEVAIELQVDGLADSRFTATAGAARPSWGAFELTIEDGPTGDVELVVGVEDADGQLVPAVRVAVDIR